jgi:hypothetical protein
MELTVLEVPDCPNAPLMAERVAGLIAGRRGVTLTRRVITDETEAARLGMHGSPTLLIDGSDPFPVQGAPPGLSCRLYPAADGRVARTPSVTALRAALERAGLPA